MHPRRGLKRAGAVTGLTVVSISALLLVGGASGPTDPVQPSPLTFNPRLEAPSPSTPLLSSPPAAQVGRWNLSPTQSAIGRAVSATLPGRTARVVESERALVNGVLVGHDTAELRAGDGAGLQFEFYAAWARYELDEAKPAQRADRGIYWVGGTADDIQSIYYLSDSGRGVWVGHYSASPGDQVSTQALIGLAETFASELERQGMTPSRVVTRQEMQSG